MKKTLFVYHVNIEEALEWSLHKETLRQALIDEAEDSAGPDVKGERGEPFVDVECDAEVTVEGEDFVVRFTADDQWKRELHSGDEIRISSANNEIGPSIIIQQINYVGEAVQIMTADGEEIECLIKEIC